MSKRSLSFLRAKPPTVRMLAFSKAETVRDERSRSSMRVFIASAVTSPAVSMAAGCRGKARCSRQLLFSKADYCFELGDHYLNGLLERHARGKRAVGFNRDAQAVKVGAVADAHVLYFVVNAADGRENGIN